MKKTSNFELQSSAVRVFKEDEIVRWEDFHLKEDKLNKVQEKINKPK